VIAAWFEFAAICAFIGVVGWMLWDDISTWFNAGYDQMAVCAGCRKGAIVPGCPLHDPLGRLGRDPEAAQPASRAEAS